MNNERMEDGKKGFLPSLTPLQFIFILHVFALNSVYLFMSFHDSGDPTFVQIQEAMKRRKKVISSYYSYCIV